MEQYFYHTSWYGSAAGGLSRLRATWQCQSFIRADTPGFALLCQGLCAVKVWVSGPRIDRRLWPVRGEAIDFRSGPRIGGHPWPVRGKAILALLWGEADGAVQADGGAVDVVVGKDEFHRGGVFIRLAQA